MIPSGWVKTDKGGTIMWSHPQSRMDLKSLPDDFFKKSTPLQKAIELIWLNAKANLENTNNEIIVPFNVIQRHGYSVLTGLALRLG